MQIICMECKKAFHITFKRLLEARNAVIVMTKVTATPTLTSEVFGRIAQGNYMFVRKLKIS